NAHLVAMVGADWWRDASAPFLPDHSTNPGIGGSNWVDLSTQWQTVGYYSMSTTQFEANLPPPLVGSAQSAPVVSPDTVAPAAPQIAAFTPDTGTVGDKVTDASILTVTGTAEGGSTVKLLDGTTVIGTVKANASGAWSLTTAEMSSGLLAEILDLVLQDRGNFRRADVHQPASFIACLIELSLVRSELSTIRLPSLTTRPPMIEGSTFTLSATSLPVTDFSAVFRASRFLSLSASATVMSAVAS